MLFARALDSLTYSVSLPHYPNPDNDGRQFSRPASATPATLC